MKQEILHRAGRVIECIAARHAVKLPGDLLADIHACIAQIQDEQRKDSQLAYWPFGQASEAETARQNGEGKEICNGGNPLGCVNDVSPPEVKARRKTNRKQSN